MSAGSARAAAVNQWVEFASQGVDYAPQLVVGDSGTLLGNNGGNQSQAFVPDATGTNAGAAYALPGVAGTPTVLIRATADRSEYGFTVLDATQAGCVAQVHNLTSNTRARCVITLSPRSMRCAR